MCLHNFLNITAYTITKWFTKRHDCLKFAEKLTLRPETKSNLNYFFLLSWSTGNTSFNIRISLSGDKKSADNVDNNSWYLLFVFRSQASRQIFFKYTSQYYYFTNFVFGEKQKKNPETHSL